MGWRCPGGLGTELSPRTCRKGGAGDEEKPPSSPNAGRLFQGNVGCHRHGECCRSLQDMEPRAGLQCRLQCVCASMRVCVLYACACVGACCTHMHVCVLHIRVHTVCAHACVLNGAHERIGTLDAGQSPILSWSQAASERLGQLGAPSAGTLGFLTGVLQEPQ